MISFRRALLWNSWSQEGQQRVQHKHQQGVLMLSVLELSLYQFQHLDVQLVPCTDFSIKVKKKKSSWQNPTNRAQPSHSFLEKSVGFKACSCLTCIISPSTHQSITVLLCGAARPKIYSDLNKGLKPEKRKQKTLSSSNRFKLKAINGAMTAFLLIVGVWLFFVTWQDDSVSWWKKKKMNWKCCFNHLTLHLDDDFLCLHATDRFQVLFVSCDLRLWSENSFYDIMNIKNIPITKTEHAHTQIASYLIISTLQLLCTLVINQNKERSIW